MFQQSITILAMTLSGFQSKAAQLFGNLFKTYDSLVCIFSLGAVIRMVAPHLINKKSDPAILVIDDRANNVISALSGHLGGANALARLIGFISWCPANNHNCGDVNETIAVDLVGREFDWTVENFENVTKVSAFMVNEEKIAIYQDAGEKNWWHSPLPKNVAIIDSIDQIKSPEFKAGLINF